MSALFFRPRYAPKEVAREALIYSGVQESITKNVPGKAWPAALNRSDTRWYREDLQRSRVHFLVVEAAAMNRSVLP
ncbi:hypothetical protein [Massilia agri]|uniref:Uncharacterized protein n=1 Tax=Massilia agri TaxID=1886785 RepID=A0ABT2ANN0_9BURK|nr:hypothetical protein [Massilia agri]MCS0597363.1 hypothetical protein [Massilia agri]